MSERRPRPQLQMPKPTPDDFAAWVAWRKEQPIERAKDKLYRFVGDCVDDRDFRHDQSAELLRFLLLVRDVLADRVNEHWTLDDFFEPYLDAVRRAVTERQTTAMVSTRKAAAEANEARNADIRATYAFLRANGTRAVGKTVAAQFGISESRVRAIVGAKEKQRK